MLVPTCCLPATALSRLVDVVLLFVAETISIYICDWEIKRKSHNKTFVLPDMMELNILR